MHIDIAPETERLIREEIGSGNVHSVDELIKAGVAALREKIAACQSPTPAGTTELPKLPVLHLGPMGPLHRRDIYDDAR